MFHSNFKPWSVGVVVANKEIDSDIVKIHPIEIVPFKATELNDESTDLKKQGVSHDGKLYTVEITEQDWLEAEWIGSTYFEKSPDVANGEQVLLFKSGDGDKFYWDVFGRDDSNRKQEDVIISFSAKPDYDPLAPVPKDETNSYRLRFNTYEKFIELTTSEANGEVTTYTIKFDMATGTWKHSDKQGNYMFLDSINTVIELFNKDLSKIRLDKKEIFISSVDLIQMDTTNITFNCENYVLTCTNMEMNAEEATWNSTNGTFNIDNGTVNGTGWTFNADVTMSKTLEVSGKSSLGEIDVGGTSKFNPPLKVKQHSIVEGS